MTDWLQPTERFDLIGLLIGLALLVAGRKLYWLALGAAGFVLGLELGRQLDVVEGDVARFALAAALGIAGIVLAFVAQKVAVTVGGLVIGGLGGLWLAQPWQADLGPWIWAAAALGALIGAGFASMVFDLALVVLTSWIGALIATNAVGLVDTWRPFVFAGFLIFGLVAQTRRGRRARI